MNIEEEIYKRLKKFAPIEDGVSSSSVGIINPFNHIKNLIVKRGEFLDAFINGEDFPPYEIEIQMSSSCNLDCIYCIGKEIEPVSRLKDIFSENNIEAIIDKILDFRIRDKKIGTIKFSGLMGDPLISRMKGVTLKAINKILSNNETQKDPKPVKIGLFTNGLEMTEDTWETLSQISYIHISLDAGQYTYRQVKRKRKTQSNFLYQDQDNSFFNILKNINGLNDYCRKKNESRIIKQNGKDAAKLEINIGFVIVPENYLEIPETTKMVKDKGADSIRFKCDIGDMHVLNDDMLNVISNIINKARIENTVNEGKEEKAFQVYMIHSVDDIRDKKHKQWRCSDGCYIHNFFSTIGSDGNFYSCDHNTIKPNKSFGSVLTDNPLTKIWLSAEKKYLNEHLKEFCKCKVCPPFGNEANPFLDKVREYIDLGFTKEVLLVIDRIRQEYKKQDKR